jgi:hypothetical protein
MRKRRLRGDSASVPNPVMDIVLLATSMLLLLFSIKVLPTAPARFPKADTAAEIENGADRDTRDRAIEVRRKYADRLIALPPLGGWVALAIDISPSVTLDQLQPAEATVVAALILNHKDITHLRVTVFGGHVREVTDWVELNSPNRLTADEQDTIARWLRDEVGASEEAAMELSQNNRSVVLAEVLAGMAKVNNGTNLVGAISDAVTVAGGHAPATAIIVTDGVHTVNGDGTRAPAPNDIPAVRKLLDDAMAKLPGHGSVPPPTVHAIALLGEPAWTGKRKGKDGSEPPAEDVVGLLRGLAGRFGGTVLALPCQPGDWGAAKGLHRLLQRLSPIPVGGPAGNPSLGQPALPGTPPTSSDPLFRNYWGNRK